MSNSDLIDLILSPKDILIIRYILMTSVLNPDDARDVEAINGFTFRDLCPILVKIDDAIYPLDREVSTVSLTRDEWLILKDCYITNVGGIGIWRSYECISPYNENDFNDCKEKMFDARRLHGEKKTSHGSRSVSS